MTTKTTLTEYQVQRQLFRLQSFIVELKREQANNCANCIDGRGYQGFVSDSGLLFCSQTCAFSYDQVDELQREQPKSELRDWYEQYKTSPFDTELR